MNCLDFSIEGPVNYRSYELDAFICPAERALPPCSEQARKEIALLARRRECRIIPRSPEMPCDWQPTTVTNPSSGICFTDITAWGRIAELAETGYAIEEIQLDQPKGETGFVMNVKLDEKQPELYIKVQLKRGKIFGRSFHYSTK